MKLIRSRVNENQLYHEIELQDKFLFWTYNRIYRKMSSGTIFRYIAPNEYIRLGFTELLYEIDDYFDIPLT